MSKLISILLYTVTLLSLLPVDVHSTEVVDGDDSIVQYEDLTDKMPPQTNKTRRSANGEVWRLTVRLRDLSTVTLNLIQTDGILANSRTPLWSATGTQQGRVSYRSFTQNLGQKIGEFSLWQDYENEAAVAYFHREQVLWGHVQWCAFKVTNVPPPSSRRVSFEDKSREWKSEEDDRLDEDSDDDSDDGSDSDSDDDSDEDSDDDSGSKEKKSHKKSKEGKRHRSKEKKSHRGSKEDRRHGSRENKSHEGSKEDKSSWGTRVRPNGPRDNAYPQLLILLDWDYVQNSDTEAIQKVLAWWNFADMLYVGVPQPRIRLNIAKIVIAENEYTNPWIKEVYHAETDTFIANHGLEAAGRFYSQQQAFSSDRYSFIVSYISSVMRTPAGGIVGGVSHLATSCERRVDRSILISYRTASYSVAARELGHALGCKYDQEYEECRNGGRLMSSVDHRNYDGLRWSKCSLNAFHEYFSKSTSKCLYNCPTTLGIRC